MACLSRDVVVQLFVFVAELTRSGLPRNAPRYLAQMSWSVLCATTLCDCGFWNRGVDNMALHTCMRLTFNAQAVAAEGGPWIHELRVSNRPCRKLVLIQYSYRGSSAVPVGRRSRAISERCRHTVCAPRRPVIHEVDTLRVSEGETAALAGRLVGCSAVSLE